MAVSIEIRIKPFEKKSGSTMAAFPEAWKHRGVKRGAIMFVVCCLLLRKLHFAAGVSSALLVAGKKGAGVGCKCRDFSRK